MAATELHNRAYGTESVTKQKLNVTLSGSAVVARLVVGTLVSFSSTGVDTGTGDVTISVSTPAQAAINFSLYRSVR